MTRVSVTGATALRAHLEFGTARLAPRPWLRPSLEAVRPALIARLRRALRRSLAR